MAGVAAAVAPSDDRSLVDEPPERTLATGGARPSAGARPREAPEMLLSKPDLGDDYHVSLPFRPWSARVERRRRSGASGPAG